MKTSTHSPFRIIVIIGLVAMMLALAFPASATVETVVPTLRCSQAVVDGDPAEWNLTNDFVAEMYRAWDASKPVEAKLYMRYDVATSTAYVLVLATDGVPGLRLAGAAWVAEGSVSNKVVTDGSGNDGILPDFSWVGTGYDGDPGHVRGYEAAFALTPGGHRIAAHLQVFDAGAPQTGGTNNKLIDIQTGCGVLGSIGDYVWNDADWAKDQDPIEPELRIIEVRLLRDNGDGTTTLLRTEVTDPNGWYLFDNLEAGQYLVDVDNLDAFTQYGMVLTTANDPLLVPLGAGEHVRWADFGFATVLNTEVALGDYVWYDKDADGQQDSYPGNPAMDESSTNAGLQCVTVKLYMNDVNDPLATPVWIGQANTDSFGLYQFVRLPEGAYSVWVDQNDVDIAQIADWSNPTKPCHKVAEWVNLAGGPPVAMRPLGATTPAVVGPYFIPGGTANWTYDFGFTTSPTAVSLQTLSATSLAGLPAGTVLMVPGLVAVAAAMRRRLRK